MKVNETTPKGILHPKGDNLRRWNVIFVSSCMISLLLDPLFFFLPLINEEKKCIGFDKKLWTTVIVLRSVNDFIKLVHIILQFRTAFIDKELQILGRAALITDSRKIALRYLWPFNKAVKDVQQKEKNNRVSGGCKSQDVSGEDKIGGLRLIKVTQDNNKRRSCSCSWSWPYFLIDILVILPIPQVVMSSIFSEMRQTKSSNIIKLLNFVVLFQYVPRVIQIYQSRKKLIRSDEIFETTIWFKAAVNLFLYLLAGHVLGALWYFFSTQRVTACWHMSCKSHIECVGSSFNCDHSLGNHSFLNDFCPITKPNATIFDFGIFVDVLQSGAAESQDFPQKLFYCFWWGMQNLSSLGQNLRPSNYVWENLFALSISISGLFLFLYIVGILQMYMLLKTSKSEEARMKMKSKKRTKQREAIALWSSKYNLSPNIGNPIIEEMNQRFQEDEDVYLENLLPNLHGGVQDKLKEHICLQQLKNVEVLQGIDEPLLRKLCHTSKPVFYNENNYIIREGDPIDAIFLITDGVAFTYTKTTSNEGEGHTERVVKNQFFGIELLQWLRQSSSESISNLSQLPVSKKVFKTHTKVEAFVLMADDLKKIWSSKLSNIQEEKLESEAASMVQRAWRHKQQQKMLHSQATPDAVLQILLGNSHPNTDDKAGASI